MKTRVFISRECGNSAVIEELMMYPYKGAAAKEIGYRLCCYSEYDNHMLYHCSCYETYEEAYNHMMKLSCGIWEKIGEWEVH